MPRSGWVCLLTGLLGCAGAKTAPVSTSTPPVASAPAPAIVVATEGAPYLRPGGFSPSGDHVVYLRGGLVTVVRLADCSVLAGVDSELVRREGEGLSLTLPSDDTLLIAHSTWDEHHNETRLEELRSLPKGDVVSHGPGFDWFETAHGRVRLELQQGEEDEALSIHAVLRSQDGGERRFDVKRTFGDGPRIVLHPLAAVRDTLIVMREVGAAVSYRQLGSIHLRTGAARQLTSPIGVTGQVVVNRDRVAFVQDDRSPAFVYELPSLRRIATIRPESAEEVTLETVSIGGSYSCVALSPANDALALWQGDGSIAWFSARSGQLLRKTNDDDIIGGNGFRNECWLTFSAGAERIVLAGARGGIRVVDTKTGKVVVRHDLLNCQSVGSRDNCYVTSALSPNARFFAADNVKERDRQSSPQGQPHGYLVDLDTDEMHDLGPLQPPPRFDGPAPLFDPSGRRLLRAGRVFSTAPFAPVCDLP